MHHSLIQFAITRRKAVYWAVALMTVVFAALLPLIQIDTDPENMLTDDDPARMFHNQTKQTFAMHDAIVVGVVNEMGVYNPATLGAVKKVTDYAANLNGVVKADLMSLSNVDNVTQAGPGTISFEWMMQEPPATDAEAQYIRNQVERLPLLFDTLVSADGKAASIYVPIVDKNASYAIARELRGYIDTLNSDDQWHITGLPVAEDRFGYEMFVQMGISAPLAGLMIFLLLWGFFRNIPFIVAPMIVAMVTVIVTMGLLIGLGFTVHIMSSMIAIFLMPIAVVDSVHILSEFSDRYRRGSDAGAVVREVMDHLFTPMLFTSVTSSVGFLSLMLTPIPPVQIFGAFVAFGIMLAFALTIVFIPAYLTGLSPATLERFRSQLPDSQNSRLSRGLMLIGRLARSRAKLWVSGFVVVLGFSVYGITLIQINDNPVRWFKSDHELRIADRVLNEHFGGTYNAYLVLESDLNPVADTRALLTQATEDSATSGDTVAWLREQRDLLQESEDTLQEPRTLDDLILAVDDRLFASNDDAPQLEALLTELESLNSASKAFLDPDRLAYIADLQTHLQASGRVGKSSSLADVVKTVNRELLSGAPQDYRLPETANGVAQALMQYQSSHRPQDLWHFATPDYSQTLIWLQLTSGDNQDMTAVVHLVDDYLAQHPLPEGISAQWAGKAYLNVIWQQQMVEGMLGSLLSAFFIVLVMMVLLFRSLVFGLLTMLPLTLTITFIYGLTGWIGKDYDMPIAVLSALTLGLSVDFAIHFTERVRATFAETGNWKRTLEFMFQEPARAIARNAIVISIGFTPLLFAPLVPYITVGVFLASIMAISALVTLVMLPSVMTLLRPWLFKNTH